MFHNNDIQDCWHILRGCPEIECEREEKWLLIQQTAEHFLSWGILKKPKKNQILWLRLVLDIDWAGDWTYHRKLACDPPSHVDSPKMFERVSQPSWTQTRVVEERHSRQHLTQHVCARELFLIDLKRRHPAWRIVCERVFSMAVRWWT